MCNGFVKVSPSRLFNRISCASSPLMYRLQYRNFGGDPSDDETLVVNHTVDVGSDHAGVRWYELNDNGIGGWTMVQQGTYAPDADHRWMGSAAMNGITSQEQNGINPPARAARTIIRRSRPTKVASMCSLLR